MATDETEKPSEEPMKPEEPTAPAAAEMPAPPAPGLGEPEPPRPPDAFQQAGNAIGNTVNQAFQPGGVDQNKFILIVVLSILGLGCVGAILNGQVNKGIAEIIALGACIATICIGIGALLIPFVALGIAIDSIVIGYRINQGERFGDWDFFWKPTPPKV